MQTSAEAAMPPCAHGQSATHQSRLVSAAMLGFREATVPACTQHSRLLPSALALLCDGSRAALTKRPHAHGAQGRQPAGMLPQCPPAYRRRFCSVVVQPTGRAADTQKAVAHAQKHPKCVPSHLRMHSHGLPTRRTKLSPAGRRSLPGAGQQGSLSVDSPAF